MFRIGAALLHLSFCYYQISSLTNNTELIDLARKGLTTQVLQTL